VNVFDLIVLAILAALTLRGIWKGMVSQIVSVASYFVCWIVASRFGGLVAPTIPVEAPWNQVLAMAIIFLITLVAIRFGSAALERLIKHWHLQKLNTLLGGILGFAKGLLLCMILTFFAVMFSETSRTVVFNSKLGFRLAQLIMQIGVFVPKDSYEFVHSQLSQFHDKVEAAVPGQTSDIVPIQSSAMMQQMLSQLQQSKGTAETKASSLWTALSRWWNSTKSDDTPEAAAVTTPTQPIPNDVPSQSLAATYTPSSTSFISQANTYSEVARSAVPQPAIAVDEFFVQRPTGANVPLATPQQTVLLPSIAEVPATPTTTATTTTTMLAPLTSLAPLSEVLSMLPEPVQLLPTLPVPTHVGSDMLLRNSAQPMNPNASAGVFRPQ